MSSIFGFVWFILMLVPLIVLQRLLHREIQAVFLILTRDTRLTMGIFSMLFLPGVFLHEISHFDGEGVTCAHRKVFHFPAIPARRTPAAWLCGDGPFRRGA
jgi:hypothetical protein